ATTRGAVSTGSVCQSTAPGSAGSTIPVTSRLITVGFDSGNAPVSSGPSNVSREPSRSPNLAAVCRVTATVRVMVSWVFVTIGFAAEPGRRPASSRRRPAPGGGRRRQNAEEGGGHVPRVRGRRGQAQPRAAQVTAQLGGDVVEVSLGQSL